jgi:hypothetical protein
MGDLPCLVAGMGWSGRVNVPLQVQGRIMNVELPRPFFEKRLVSGEFCLKKTRSRLIELPGSSGRLGLVR